MTARQLDLSGDLIEAVDAFAPRCRTRHEIRHSSDVCQTGIATDAGRGQMKRRLAQVGTVDDFDLCLIEEHVPLKLPKIPRHVRSYVSAHPPKHCECRSNGADSIDMS